MHTPTTIIIITYRHQSSYDPYHDPISSFTSFYLSPSDYLTSFLPLPLLRLLLLLLLLPSSTRFATIIKRFLSLAIIPIQSPRNTIHPIFTATIQRENRGKRESTGGDGDVVSWCEFTSVFLFVEKKHVSQSLSQSI